MHTRILFPVGLVLLMLALGGLVLLSTRAFPRETLVSSVSGEALLPLTLVSSLIPTPTPTPTTPSETPGAPIYHTVRYGETLFTIGRLYRVNPYAIARANGIPNPNYIYAGQVLLIPQGGGTTPPVPTVVISGPTSGSVGETLRFNATDSTDDGHIMSYAWDFGDGTTASGINVTHVYTKAGSYKVTLTVTDDGGLSDSTTHTVQVSESGSENQRPKAVISGPTSSSVGERLRFNATDSTDDGHIMSYAWDFGDGTTDSGINVTHVYTKAGSYKVTLTVTDDGGLSDSATLKIQEPTEMIEAEWPKKMEIERSDSIRVSLVRTTDQVFVPTIEIAGHTVIAASPIPIGTEEALTERAFGRKYKASAIANLAGTAFEISPVTTEYQSLEQSRITWEWNIMPEKVGPQTINATIQVQWEPIGSDGETIQRPIWRSRLDILVEKPFITTGQLNVFSLVSLFVGSTLSVPWLYERIRERREKRQKDKESKPKIYLP